MSGLNKRWQFMTLPLPFLSLNLMPIRVVLLRNATWDFCIKWDWSTVLRIFVRPSIGIHARLPRVMQLHGTIWVLFIPQVLPTHQIDLAKALSCYEKAHELGFSAMHLEELRSRLG
jgi:hypothetical protein